MVCRCSLGFVAVCRVFFFAVYEGFVDFIAVS